MGMYSYIGNQSVEVVDIEGLREFLKDILSGNNPNYSPNQYYLVQEGLGFHTIEDIDKFNTPRELDFKGMDGWKIIQYWYPEFIMFMRDLAVFVEGMVEFDYETGDEKAELSFEDGKFSIKLGTLDWKIVEVNDLRDAPPEMDKKTKSRLMLRQL